MTRLMHPSELERQRERDRFDPIAEGARHGLSRELSLAIWGRAYADATDSIGRCDELRARQQFHELAARIAARGARLRPDPGRITRVDVEMNGHSPQTWGADEIRRRVPGRETLVVAEARRWTPLDGEQVAASQRAEATEAPEGATGPSDPPGASEVARAIAALQSPVRRERSTEVGASGHAPLGVDPALVQQSGLDRDTGEVPARLRDLWNIPRPGAMQVAGAVARAASANETRHAATISRQHAESDAGDPTHPAIQEALRLRGRGSPLPDAVRQRMEARLGVDLHRVRVHVGQVAEQAARAIHAKAFTTGEDIFFAKGEFAPESPTGLELIAHELTHVVQGWQGRVPAPSAGPIQVSRPDDVLEREAEAAGRGAMRETAPALRFGGYASHGAVLQRAPKGAAEGETKDLYKGTMVSQIIISLARRRVGFKTPLGVIFGTVGTDLKAGNYELTPELSSQRWNITGPGVKSGPRFEVTLEGADPWTLSYPPKLPLLVAAGSTKEPKTFGDALAPSGTELTDPLWPYEGMPLLQPIAGIDDFESVRYDLDYRSVKGNLSKFLVVDYRDNSHKDISIDDIGPGTPRLLAAKQEALKVMDDYNTMFILGSFPTVFFILTIQPMATAPEGAPARYSASRRSVAKPGGGAKEEIAPSREPAPKANEPPPAKAPVSKAEAENLITGSEGRPGPGTNVGHAEDHIPPAGATDAEAKLLAESRPTKANTTTFRTRRHATQILRDIMNENRAEIDALPPDGVTSAGGTQKLPATVPGFNSQLGKPATSVNIGSVSWRIVRLTDGQLHLVHFAPSKI